MSKTKMRCITCGKWFQSANAKEVTCPDCTQKARKEKMAAKQAPSLPNRPLGPGSNVPNQGHSMRPPAQPKPRPLQSGTSHWLDTLDDVKVGQPEQPPPRTKLPTPPPAARETRDPRDQRSSSGPGNYRGPGSYYRDPRDQRPPEGGRRGPGQYREPDYRGPGAYREQEYRGPGAYRMGGPGASSTIGQRPRHPVEGIPGRGPRPDGPRQDRPPRPGGPSRTSAQGSPKPKPKGARPPKPALPAKPKREKIPPPPPFAPTSEQIAQIEARYIELAIPDEFDGIRTQIAKELNIPKKAVKKIVKDLRDRQSLPSWWELQTYKGSLEEMERIKAVYQPMLPVPPVGVHKKIAEELSLKAGTVYQAIKAIRQELNLPQYNDPTTHESAKDIQDNQQLEAAVEATSTSNANAADGSPEIE